MPGIWRLSLALLVVGCAVAIPGPNGIDQPAATYQRWRRNEYPSEKPFFQWWYYCLKDLESGTYFAIAYSVNIVTVSNKSSEGAFITFARVTPEGNSVQMEQFPLANLNITGDFSVQMGPGADPQAFQLLPQDTASNTIRLTGRIPASSENTWHRSGAGTGQAVSWDLTLHRIYGWYAQDYFEHPDHLWGDIMWNTYAHDSEVEGYVKVGNVTFTFSRQPRFRIYGDMNWGSSFPQPPPNDHGDLDYNWGWYTVVIPSSNISQEISIVAGVGLTDVGFPFYSMVGRFADVRVGAGLPIHFIEVGFLEETPLSQNVSTTNDGTFVVLHVDRTNWTQWTDSLGTAQIPLSQTVTMASSQHSIKVAMTSTLQNYNRLVFPFQDTPYSDFEGLGVQAHVVIVNLLTGATILDTQVSTAGIEFGYQVTIK